MLALGAELCLKTCRLRLRLLLTLLLWWGSFSCHRGGVLLNNLMLLLLLGSRCRRWWHLLFMTAAHAKKIRYAHYLTSNAQKTLFNQFVTDGSTKWQKIWLFSFHGFPLRLSFFLEFSAWVLVFSVLIGPCFYQKTSRLNLIGLCSQISSKGYRSEISILLYFLLILMISFHVCHQEQKMKSQNNSTLSRP